MGENRAVGEVLGGLLQEARYTLHQEDAGFPEFKGEDPWPFPGNRRRRQKLAG